MTEQLTTGGKVEPIVVETDSDGSVSYHSVIAVKADSPYQSLDDLKGKSLAFADPNLTSGFVAPSYFPREEGINPESFFGRTGFSGSHENGILAVLNGTYDAAATSWTNEERSNVVRMESKGMIPKGQIRYVWKSPKLPNGPWAMHADLPMAASRHSHDVQWYGHLSRRDRGLEIHRTAGVRQVIRRTSGDRCRMGRIRGRHRLLPVAHGCHAAASVAGALEAGVVATIDVHPLARGLAVGI